MPLRAGLSFGDQLLLGLRDKVGVLAMSGDDDTEFLGETERVIQLGVLNPEGSLVGKEHLERGHAFLLHDGFQGIRRGVVEAGDAGMERVVAR